MFTVFSAGTGDALLTGMVTHLAQERDTEPSRPLDEVPRVLAPQPRIEAAGATDIGLARRTNQDQFLIADLSRELNVVAAGPSVPFRSSEKPQGMLLAVADGMGGHGGGDVASSVVIEAFARYANGTLPWFGSETPPSDRSLQTEFRRAASHCLRKLEEAAIEKGISAQRPGTTLTAACVVWPHMYLLNVGDSRCYLLRGGRLRRVTRDHTVAQEMHDTDPDSRIDVDNGPYSHVLTNAVGGGVGEPHPDATRLSLRPGDVIMMCSDGLTGEVPDKRIHEVLASGGSAEELAAELIERAVRAGGHDNITALVARVIED